MINTNHCNFITQTSSSVLKLSWKKGTLALFSLMPALFLFMAACHDNLQMETLQR